VFGLIAIVVALGAAGELLYGAAPHRSWRFSLRALLIATALVAMVLGLVVYIATK